MLCLRLFSRICFDAHQRRKTPRRIHRLDAALSGLDGRQPLSLPAVPRHIRPARQLHPRVAPVNPFPLPYPLTHTAAQRVVEIPPLRQDGVVLCAHIVDQPVLVIVFVPVCTFVVHPYHHPFRDAVRFLRQPAVFVVAVQVLHIFRDAVIRPYPAAALRVKLRVRQAVSRRVRGIREGDVQILGAGMHPGQAPAPAVAVLPRLLRSADAYQPAPLIVTVLPV